MLKELSHEQFSKILEKLPEDLKKAFFSVETADKINEVCEKYKIAGERVPFVVNYTGQVLLGILSPEELEGMLEKEAGLKKDIARGVSQQIYRYIFFPVKESLSALSGISQAPPLPKKEEAVTEKTEPSVPSKPDTYREPLE